MLDASAAGRGKSVESVAPVAAPKRYGYIAAHRREAGQYSTDLTDAEWHLVADLFERPEGSRGAPARYERRHLVDACYYVLRTDCAWQLLPSSFVPWQVVYKAFARWVEIDAFERMAQAGLTAPAVAGPHGPQNWYRALPFIDAQSIGRTKTLAKLANHVAKTADRKPGSYPADLAHVCNLEALPPSDRDAVLQATDLGEV